MDNKITINLDLLKILLDQESKRLVGKVMKRFDLSDDKNIIKSQVKEILYEEMRDLGTFFINGKLLLTFNEKSKEDSNGK